MCGIAGFVAFRAGSPDVLAEQVKTMADTIAHRGPDDWGTWVDPDSGLALGQRRLSIIDCSPAGHQPMLSADEAFVIAYNGEIYNYGELAIELDRAGVIRRGHSDTEVILEAFARGNVADILPRLAGMFALALWDRRYRRLILARDPLGIKPLYWGRAGDGTFLFGSELKALRAHPSWDFSIDPNAVAAYFRFGYVPAPASVYCGVSKLAPGHMLIIDSAGKVQDQPFWRLDEVAEQGQANQFAMNDEDATDALESLLSTVVGQHLIADVPVGAFLSGGIDSSAVVAMMCREAGRTVRTFTIGYAEKGFDESSDAARIARHLGTDHTELTATAEQAQAVIPRLADLYDEPFADSSAIPTFLVSELTRQHVTVALSGDGGDEMFAGYNRHVFGEIVQKRTAGLPGFVRKGGAAALTMLSADAWDNTLGRLPFAPRLFGNKAHKLAAALKADDVGGFYESLVTFWPEGIARGSSAGLGQPRVAVSGVVEAFQYLDMATYLPDDILTKLDRASMAVALESRVPLLDRRVAEFAWRLPRSMRLRNRQGKWLLRQVLYRHVPKALLDRPKMGFAVPFGTWLRGPLRDWAEDLLSADSLASTGLIDPGPIRRRWAEHLKGQGSHDHHLWIVLMFTAWARRWI